jgi:hypothetical protein
MMRCWKGEWDAGERIIKDFNLPYESFLMMPVVYEKRPLFQTAEKGSIKFSVMCILKKVWLLFQKKADDVNRHGEDDGGILLRGNLR